MNASAGIGLGRSFARLIRPHTFILVLLAFLIGTAAAPAASRLPAILSLFLLTSFASIQNDLADQAIDRDNGKLFLGPKGIGEKSARLWLLITFAAALLSGLLFPSSLFFILALLACSFLYSSPPFLFSRRPWLGPLTVAVGYSLLPMAWGLSLASSLLPSLLPLLLGWFLLRLSTVPWKDAGDLKGDRKHGKRTFLLTYGLQALKIFSTATFLLSLISLGIFLPRHSLSPFLVLPLLFSCYARLSLTAATTEKEAARLFPRLMLSDLLLAAGFLAWLVTGF